MLGKPSWADCCRPYGQSKAEMITASKVEGSRAVVTDSRRGLLWSTAQVGSVAERSGGAARHMGASGSGIPAGRGALESFVTQTTQEKASTLRLSTLTKGYRCLLSRPSWQSRTLWPTA